MGTLAFDNFRMTPYSLCHLRNAWLRRTGCHLGNVGQDTFMSENKIVACIECYGELPFQALECVRCGTPNDYPAIEEMLRESVVWDAIIVGIFAAVSMVLVLTSTLILVFTVPSGPIHWIGYLVRGASIVVVPCTLLGLVHTLIEWRKYRRFPD